MKKQLSIILIVISMLLGFGTLSFGQVPDISGDWLLDLSGVFRGGALIKIDAEGNFGGYGFGLQSGGRDANGVLLSGHVDVDAKGKITGTYTATDLNEGTPLAAGNISGKVDRKITKLSLRLENGPNGKAVKLPADPDIPLSWTATAKSSKADLTLTVESLTHDDDLDMDFPHRLYRMTGTGVAEESLAISVQGGFFLNSKSIAYGWYEVREVSEDIRIEEGFFFGKVNLKPGKSSFSFKLTGFDPYDGSMLKAVLKGMAD